MSAEKKANKDVVLGYWNIRGVSKLALATIKGAIELMQVAFQFSLFPTFLLAWSAYSSVGKKNFVCGCGCGGGDRYPTSHQPLNGSLMVISGVLPRIYK